MSDLISRKAILEVFEDYGFSQETMIPTISIMRVLEIIESQPTAYDVDKVVEQLKKTQDKYDYWNSGYSAGDKADAIDEAIDIVKGAVKDE